MFSQSLPADSFTGLRARAIGARPSPPGRVMTIAVDPSNSAVFYVGAASGGVWKTVNGGATWQPVFDTQGSYSIGWITLDARRPNVVWVGTGERNSQRSVSYGDGVYKSDDGGRSWTNVGLKTSEHIGRIVIDPKDSDTVYVAAQGPLWAAGGDRGLYKTTDGGKTWTQVLKISEHTGVTDVVVDPRNPDVVVAAAYQRRRHFFTLINGGPESAIHRSTDGGKTWKKATTGLPDEQLGRIGLAISPVNPDVLYANVEAANNKGGIYRSSDNGVTWEKRSDYNQGSMYYGDVFPDPVSVDRLYIPRCPVPGVRRRRQDAAAARDAQHARRQSHHLGRSGEHQPPSRRQRRRLVSLVRSRRALDLLREPAAAAVLRHRRRQRGALLQHLRRDAGQLLARRTGANAIGARHPERGLVRDAGRRRLRVARRSEDPNTIYAELQHGVIVRYDKRTGERVGIQPQEEKGGAPQRWNWDSPFIISPHLHTRLYFGAQFLYRSDDKGNSWKVVSPDLTRQIDRNTLPVMGRIWGPDAVAKNTSTALYGNLSAIAESPKKEGLLYVGTDDGLVQVSDDGGGAWRKAGALPGVPADAYVARIRASQHDAATVYVAAENHQNGDFAPYLLKSTDSGRSWKSITGDLPARGSTYAIAEDHVDPNLLFTGTEFAAYWSKDGGQHWIKIAGLPTIACGKSRSRSASTIWSSAPSAAASTSSTTTRRSASRRRPA
jgi:photosystem II stability/assembly factor-like uncharacterized protein